MGGAPPVPERGQGGAPVPTPTPPRPATKPAPPKDEMCHPNPCQNGGTCKPGRNGSYKCICLVGFSGGHCQGMFYNFIS